MKTLPIFSSIFLVFSLKFSFTSACKGCVNLDEYNFDKIIPKFEAVIVKFDVAYPYGEKHETFSKFADELAGNKEIIAAEVGVKDYGDKENEELAKKYGINDKEEMPAVKLFIKSSDNYVDLPKDAPFTVENLRNLIRDNTEVYIGLPGCLEKFDAVAMEFMGAGNREELIGHSEKLLEDVDEKQRPTAKMYVQIMKKISEQGTSFVSNEKSRLNKILKEGKLNDKKKQELTYRLNILHSFSIRKDEL